MVKLKEMKNISATARPLSTYLLTLLLVMNVIVTGMFAYNLAHINDFRSAAAETNFTMGTTTMGATTDSGDSNSMTCNRYSAAQSGTVNSMSVAVGAIDATKKNYSLALYAGTATAPTTFLKSATGTLTANSWNTLSLSSPVTVGSNYWLCYNSNASKSTVNNMKYTGGTAPAVYKAQTYGTWPTTFGTVGAKWTSNYSIYATVTLSGATTPTLTPTPTIIVATPAPTSMPSVAVTATPTTGVSSTPAPTMTGTPLNGLLIGMGDSYTSAYGAPAYIAPAEPCYHSQNTSYPQVAAKLLGSGVTVKNIGCSGADTFDVQQTYSGEPAQTGRLAGAKWIAMTIGGNDYDFLGAITEGTAGPQRVISNLSTVQSRATTVINKAKTGAPGAKIFIIGYPDILPTDQSKLSASTCFGNQASKVNLTASHNMYVQLNNTLKAAANATGAMYVDAPTAFVGHDMCATDYWIAKLNQDGDMHPNVAGHQTLGNLLMQAIKATN